MDGATLCAAPTADAVVPVITALLLTLYRQYADWFLTSTLILRGTLAPVIILTAAVDITCKANEIAAGCFGLEQKLTSSHTRAGCLHPQVDALITVVNCIGDEDPDYPFYWPALLRKPKLGDFDPAEQERQLLAYLKETNKLVNVSVGGEEAALYEFQRGQKELEAEGAALYLSCICFYHLLVRTLHSAIPTCEFVSPMVLKRLRQCDDHPHYFRHCLTVPFDL